MRSQIFAAASAAVLSLALGVSCAYAGATSNEGGPANAGNPSAAQPAPNAAPAPPNAQNGGPGAQGAMPGKAEDKSAAQPSVEAMCSNACAMRSAASVSMPLPEEVSRGSKGCQPVPSKVCARPHLTFRPSLL
jgi:hypothetical protein